MNYQKLLEERIQFLQKNDLRPKLLIHSCCAPCSSYVLEYLSEYFEITVYYYNPNIYPEDEYGRRVEEQQELIHKMNSSYEIKFKAGSYVPQDFYQAVKGMEAVAEGGERCFACYELRLEEAAKLALEEGFDYFTTTLSISPLKNATKLNEIGDRLGERYGVPYLVSDFKKKNGYQRSIQLSKEYDLYRQDYCGCVFSKQERDHRISQMETQQE